MTEQKSRVTDSVRFFNISLVNGNVMSIPRFAEPQLLVGELIRSLEAASPRFAWIQFLFQRATLSSSYVHLKNAIHLAAEKIKRPKVSLVDGGEYERAELHRDWYRMAGVRIKAIDAIINKPHVLLAIQGMWVGEPKLLLSLPFKDCHDEHDRLGVFVYRNPWMLSELVERRMVADISPYFRRYTASRLEPPSFVVTQEEMPYYIHLPIAGQSDYLKSLEWRQHSSDIREGSVEGAKPSGEASPARVLRLRKAPSIREPLKEKETERLRRVASASVRGLEIIYTDGRTEILLSSHFQHDIGEYRGIIESVYGELDVEQCGVRPKFLREIPSLVGLV